MADAVIPILDLRRQYHALKAEIARAVEGVLESGHFINGPNVSALEQEVAAYLGGGYAVGLNSGTDALHLALRALGVGAGDEVITTPFTFVATTEAIAMVGATPVFADIDAATFNIDPRAIEAAITPRTRAILPVHLYGNPAPMHAIMAIAARAGLAVVEDCAQAIGASIGGRRIGTFGDAAAFSFFPSKNLGAYGDGGMLVTARREVAERVRSLRAHGGRVKYHHEEVGVNSRLDELQAAILRVKLPHLERWIERRRAVAHAYTRALQSEVSVPLEEPDYRHVYHQYTIRLAGRDAKAAALAVRGVGTMVYYPVPLHLQRVHEPLGYRRGDFEHAEAAAGEVLSLPMFPEIENGERGRVIEAVRSLFAGAVAIG
ncbi:MAG TPA: DegT/DnrJ/EryC1/StrS family aminotransferase [Candidatus Baltobacteraceae bacterium]|nr:DegT/DnrJ/EryC1/StrS family aminotransferase [Candidatus Baltobacteraceae bacterium]